MKMSQVSATLAAKLSSPRAALSETGIVIKQEIQQSEANGTFYQLENGSFASCMSCATTAPVAEPVKSIPFPDILSARYIDPDALAHPVIVEVVYAKRKKQHLIPTSLTLQIDDVGYNDIVEEIYKRSYKGSRPNKSILVLVNPHGGKGKALKLFLKRAKPILVAAGTELEVMKTEYSKHGIDIARDLDISRYDLIVCASGDGIPYEVFNGFYQRKDRADAFRKIPITQIPCGSGNAMSESCLGTSDPSFAALTILKAHEAQIDLMAVTQDGATTVSFLSQSFGVIADCDIGTEFLRFLGDIRFDIGVAYKVFSRAKYPCEISIKYAAKSKDDLRKRYHDHKNDDNGRPQMISEDTYKLKYSFNDAIPEDWERVDQDFADNISILYTGTMPYVSKDVQFFPAALPDDGTIDLVMMDARTSITRQTPILLSLESGKHVTAPEVQHSKVLAYRLTPKSNEGRISVDGEEYSLSPLQVEVLPEAAKTLLNNGGYVETNF